MTEKHTIQAVFHTDTKMMLDFLEEKGINVSVCVICGESIVATERKPIYLSECWQAWRHGKKFYDWNIGAFVSDGVVCEKMPCFVEVIYR